MKSTRNLRVARGDAQALRPGFESPTTGELLGGPGEARRDVEAYFLGPRAENAEVLERLVLEALRDHVFWRRNFHPADPAPITERVKREPGYLDAMDRLGERYHALLADLKRSAPFFSMRYQGHMIWDQTLPGIVGYFAAMLYNQNNVAREASPATTRLELRAAEELCGLIGYDAAAPGGNGAPAPARPWGHLTSGGTVANLEALWAARNLKLYPFAVRAALAEEPALQAARDLEVARVDGGRARLRDLDPWALANLPADETLALGSRIATTAELPAARVNALVAPRSVETLGLAAFARRHGMVDGPAPVVLAAGSRHYSLPKAAAILGLGAAQVRALPVDLDGRLDLARLDDEIGACLTARRPVLAVIATLGTTEEGAVDPLGGLLDLRARYRRRGLEFLVHVDAAWGGYFASLLRGAEPAAYQPMSRHVAEQFRRLPEADTVTIDPHKTGYVPYPAGALCYRRGEMRELVACDAPYIDDGDGDGSGDHDGQRLGRYGVEGSRPGAAAAAVHLSHAVIRPDRSGYGKILARALYSGKRLYARLLTLTGPDDDFLVVPTARLPLGSPALGDARDEAAAVARVRREIVERGHAALAGGENREALDLLREIGPDLNILTFAFNLRRQRGGPPNPDLALANELNRRIHLRASVRPDAHEVYGYRLMLSKTALGRDEHGPAFFDDYHRRLLGVPASAPGPRTITVLRSVIMDPWITEDLEGRPFLDTIADELRRVVIEVVAELTGPART